MRSGRYLASLLSVAEEVPSGAGTDDSSKAAMDPSVRSAALSEMDHEIIALGDRLIVNEANLEALKDGIEPDAPALVVSFLGDTSAGKSHTIRELMGTEESRPYCQDARSQKMATTFNVNLFSSTTMAPGMVVHLVDYEGENGSNTPVMMAVRTLSRRGPFALCAVPTHRLPSPRAPGRGLSNLPAPPRLVVHFQSTSAGMCFVARRLGSCACGRIARPPARSRWRRTSRAWLTRRRT